MTHSVYFGIGGDDPAMIARYKAEGKPLPVNHSPYFAPVPEPTIRTGVETLTLAVPERRRRLATHHVGHAPSAKTLIVPSVR